MLYETRINYREIMCLDNRPATTLTSTPPLTDNINLTEGKCFACNFLSVFYSLIKDVYHVS